MLRWINTFHSDSKRSTFWSVFEAASAKFEWFSYLSWILMRNSAFMTILNQHLENLNITKDLNTFFPKLKLYVQKIMVSVCWSTSGVIHYSFLESRQSITTKVYCHHLDVIHIHLSKMPTALFNRQGQIQIIDNAWPGLPGWHCNDSTTWD